MRLTAPLPLDNIRELEALPRVLSVFAASTSHLSWLPVRSPSFSTLRLVNRPASCAVDGLAEKDCQSVLRECSL